MSLLLMSSRRQAHDGLFPAEQGRLSVSGIRIYDETGRLYSSRMFSLFLAFWRFCNGDQKLSDDLWWLRSFGFNEIRVFGPLPWKELHNSYRYENFNLDRLGEFFAFVAGHGLRVEFVPLCYDFGMSQMREFLQRCYNIAPSYWNVRFNCANEPPHNDIDVLEAMSGIQRYGVLSDYGLYSPMYRDRPIPYLETGSIHTDRGDDWFRKFRDGQFHQNLSGKPHILNEPAKISETHSYYMNEFPLDEFPGRDYYRSEFPDHLPSGWKQNLDEATWYAIGMYFWTVGGCVHTEPGKWGMVPQPDTNVYRYCEIVRDAVFKKVEAGQQLGLYAGAHLGISPVDGDDLKIDGKLIWTYSSIRGNRALSVRCALSHPNVRNGWREVETWGPANSIVRCER